MRTNYMTGVTRLIALVATLILLAVAGGATSVQAANSSSAQVVFSATGGMYSLSGGGASPFGFWVWCQSATPNAYGNDCAGSMYFYALNPATESVEGTVISGSAATGYTINVWNATGSLHINCLLTNVGPATPGTTNTITASCSSPAGNGTVTNGVVSGSGT